MKPASFAMNSTVAELSASEELIGRAAGEFFEAISQGETPSIEEFAGRYPDIADHIHRVFPALLLVGSMQSDAALGHASLRECHQTLGDFRIIREIGRGGMGTVFEAEQTSMGRFVALKVLPFAELCSEESLRRFRNEVRAAAALDHSHIVRIYSVGEERGIHFYAMQLIRGQSWAEFINQLRQCQGGETSAADLLHRDALVVPGLSSATGQPFESTRLITEPTEPTVHSPVQAERGADFCRSVAKLGMQVAQALQHAHSQGVLHRDIKPSNLLLDEDFQPYITDFGLARIEADGGVTRTGDIVGTLRYMAPEQASTNCTVVDQRADVYSLGATLYELLVLQPAFRKTDNSALLRQIATEDPPSLRKLDRRIPAELETIIFKAMEKNAADRYESAGKLAADLDRYLKHEPIKATRAGFGLRIRKWTKRHRGLTVAAVLLLMVSGVSAVGSSILIAGAYAQEVDARAAADREKVLAQRQQRRAELMAARMQLERGVRALDDGKSSGLLDLVDARLTAGDDSIGVAASRLWAAASQGVTPLVNVFPGANDFAFGPGGNQLAIASENEAVIWEIPSGRKLVGPLSLQQPIDSIVFSRDGAWLAAHSVQGETRVWDAKTGSAVSPILRYEPVRHGSNEEPGSAEFSPANATAAFSADGSILAAVRLDGAVRLWGTQDWRPLRPPFGLGGAAAPMAFSPDGQEVVLAGGAPEVWDITSHPPQAKKIQQYSAALGSQQIAYSPKGSWLLFQSTGQHPVLIDQATSQTHVSLNFERDLTCSAFSPDEKLLATGARDWRVQMWDTETGLPHGRIMQHGGRMLDLCFSPDGALLASSSLDETVQVWDATTQTPVGPALLQNDAVRVKFSPRGDYLATAGDHSTRVWQVLSPLLANGREDPVGEVPDEPFAVSPNGEYRATITKDGELNLKHNGTEKIALAASAGVDMRSLAFSADSKLLVAGCDGWSIRIWEIPSGRLVKQFITPERIYGLAFSPVDPLRVAAAHLDGAARIWDLATSNQIGSPMMHDAPVWEVAFDPSGKMLATVSGHGALRGDTVRLWDVTTSTPYQSVRVPLRPQRPLLTMSSISSTLSTFDSDGLIRGLDSRTERAVQWRLATPPSDPYLMRDKTWLALGVRRTLSDNTENLTATEWQTLRDSIRRREPAKAEDGF